VRRSMRRKRPARRGHALQKREEEQSADRVQNHVRPVMHSGVESEDLAIEHVRKAGERKPIVVVEGSEGPPDAIPAESIADVRIIGDVNGIVIIDEIVRADLAVNGKCRNQKPGVSA
jgi:hypothetical protein